MIFLFHYIIITIKKQLKRYKKQALNDKIQLRSHVTNRFTAFTGKESGITMKEFKGYKRGINLGGWLSQCVHTQEHYNTFITEADIKRISEWELDHVRLPIDYELIRNNDDTYIESGFGYIDSCLEWCGKYKLNMILDLHKTAGFSFDRDGGDFFESAALQKKFISLWDELAKRYGKYDNRLAFELLNEVVDDSVEAIWNGIISRTIPVIRLHAPKIKILVGGVRNNSVLRVKGLDMPYDENIVYTFHFYEPLIFTHQSAGWIDGMIPEFTTEYPNTSAAYISATEQYLPSENKDFYDAVRTENADRSFIKTAFAKAVKIAEERNTALYCGEYGVIDKASLPATLKWYADINSVFEEYGISHAAWTYKDINFGIIDEHYSEIADKLIQLL